MMPSFSGHSGHSGHSGGSVVFGTTTALAAGSLIADRVDLPFVDEQAEIGDRTLGVREAVLTVPNYPLKRWSPFWSASLLLQDFAGRIWPDGETRVNCPGPGDLPERPKTLPDEIADLIRAAEDERADALEEIVQQSDEFVTQFLAVLGITPNSYPATARLLYAAEAIGSMAAMHFKAEFNRPRPSHLCPALRPPIPVPGHASYPSGHATQARLMALFVTDAMPKGIKENVATVVTGLADRIARNREIGGLHYRSDSLAGAALASNIFDFVKNSSRAKVERDQSKPPRNYADAIAEAEPEWR